MRIGFAEKLLEARLEDKQGLSSHRQRRIEPSEQKKNSARVKTREHGGSILFHMARTKVLLGIADDEARKMSIRETTLRNITC